MKQGIHPNYKPTTIRCACGAVIETGSTKQNITVEICSKCHPFYTGKQKLVDTSGRVDKSSTRSTASSNRIDRFTEKPRCKSSGVFRCRFQSIPEGDTIAIPYSLFPIHFSNHSRELQDHHRPQEEQRHGPEGEALPGRQHAPRLRPGGLPGLP